MDELTGLPESVRKLALDRFHLLQPHLEQNRPLRWTQFSIRPPWSIHPAESKPM
jgi:hypothetical protein